MRDYAEYGRNAVRVWMRQVMDEKGWTANEWAVSARTSPTNITRLLAPNSKVVPSIDTISKLASVARSQPNLILGGQTGERTNDAPPCNFCPDCGYDLRQVTPLPRAGPRRS